MCLADEVLSSLLNTIKKIKLSVVEKLKRQKRQAIENRRIWPLQENGSGLGCKFNI